MRRLWGVVTVVTLAAAALAGYELLRGFPRYVEDRWVHRVTVWHGYSMVMPIPYQRGTLYYAYTGPDGAEVRHGPIRMLHGNGRVSDVGAYRYGRLHGTWTTWDHRGRKTNEEFWWHGDHRGWAIYDGGTVHYYNEKICEGDRLVAFKRFEGGRWFLAVPSGVEPRLAIDRATGALTRLTP